MWSKVGFSVTNAKHPIRVYTRVRLPITVSAIITALKSYIWIYIDLLKKLWTWRIKISLTGSPLKLLSARPRMPIADIDIPVIFLSRWNTKINSVKKQVFGTYKDDDIDDYSAEFEQVYGRVHCFDFFLTAAQAIMQMRAFWKASFCTGNMRAYHK